MAIERFERFFASGIYFLTGIGTARFFGVGLANGIASGYRYSVQQKLLISAALIGATMLVFSAILIHFRPTKAYVTAMSALPLLLLAFWPFLSAIAIGVIVHRASPFRTFGLSNVFPMALLAIITVFTPLRWRKLVRS